MLVITSDGFRVGAASRLNALYKMSTTKNACSFDACTVYGKATVLIGTVLKLSRLINTAWSKVGVPTNTSCLPHLRR